MASIFFIVLIFASTTLATETIPAYHFGPDVGDWVRNSAYYISKGIADPVKIDDENDVDNTTPEPTRKIDAGELDTIAGKRGYEVYEYLDDFADVRPSNEIGKVDPYYKGPMELNTPVTPNVSDMPKADDNDLAFRTNSPDVTTTSGPPSGNKALHIALGIRDYFTAISNGDHAMAVSDGDTAILRVLDKYIDATGPIRTAINSYNLWDHLLISYF